MKILVTGSAGFLGQWFVRDLRLANHHVIGIDRNPEIESHQFIQHDLRAPVVGQKLDFDVCIHLASSVGGFLFNAHDSNLIETEILVLKNLKQLCAQSNCSRLIFASSMNVFENSGVQEEGPLKVRDQKTPYAMAKVQAESYIADHFENFSIFRPTNFFGPEQPRSGHAYGESHVIPDLLQKIREQETIEVFGDGNQIRNFIHIFDVSNFILLLLKNPQTTYAHLRSDLFLSIGELARQLLLFSNSSKQVRYLVDYLKYEPVKISNFPILAASALGWRPQIQSIQDGLLFLRTSTIRAKAINPIERREPKFEAALSAS